MPRCSPLQPGCVLKSRICIASSPQSHPYLPRSSGRPARGAGARQTRRARPTSCSPAKRRAGRQGRGPRGRHRRQRRRSCRACTARTSEGRVESLAQGRGTRRLKAPQAASAEWISLEEQTTRLRPQTRARASSGLPAENRPRPTWVRTAAVWPLRGPGGVPEHSCGRNGIHLISLAIRCNAFNRGKCAIHRSPPRRHVRYQAAGSDRRCASVQRSICVHARPGALSEAGRSIP